MSTTVVTLRIPNEVLERIDHNASQAGETRTELILSWLPEYYGSEQAAQPDVERVDGPATSISLRIDNDVLSRIDNTVLQTRSTRAEHIFRWQPAYFQRNTKNGLPDHGE